MKTQTMDTWYENNRDYLTAVLAGLRQVLQQHVVTDGQAYLFNANPADAAADNKTQYQHEADRIAAEMDIAPAIEHLCATFSLSHFERDILLLCAAMELDGGFPAVCAAAQGSSQKPYPSFGLAMAALPQAFWGAMTPAAPLRYWRLIEITPSETLTSSPLRIDERILHYLTGLNYLDERLKHFIEPLQHAESLSASQRRQSQRIEELWSGAGQSGDWPVIQLCGRDPGSKLAVVAAACEALNAQAYVLSAADIPAATVDRQSLIRLWQREILLSRNALVVECEERDANEILNRVIALSENIQGPLVISRREPLHGLKRSLVRLDVNKPDRDEQQALWQHGLAPLASKLNGELESLVGQFNLGPAAIQAASMEVLADPAIWRESADKGKLLWHACRRQARPRLDDLAQRIEPMAAWDDLVLPDTQKQILRHVVAHVRQRRKVYEGWGFAGKSNRGLGISALLAGASGTGKTMAAEVLAGELQLDLYRIDLSSVVSKYIGETEKNLRRVFDAAEEGGAILLFDEADALFGKRSEVKDSHDRYANIEVSYLLQRMESYLGLSILTTNLKSALDNAFLRRIRFVIQFPFPDLAQRMEIWRRIYPALTPTRDLEIAKLAKLSITGGNIRNIALNAAFLAAEADEPVGMPHLLAAARSEYAKLEKPLTDNEIAGWVAELSTPVQGVKYQ